MPDIINHNCILFADDISVIVTCNDLINFDDEINRTIQTVTQWLIKNNLNANLTKTNYMNFKCKQSNSIKLNVKCNDIKIDEVENTKFLGITMDTHIDWKPQIDYVCNKINKFVYVLSRLRKTASLRTTLLAYHGHVSSVLRYGLLLWGNASEVNRCFLSQKRCIRAIVGIPPDVSCKPHFVDLGILTLPCMYILEVSVFVKMHPQLFTTAKDKYPRNSRNPDRLVFNSVPRTTLFKKNCYAMCITIYNHLPTHIKKLTLYQFKKHLKEWLLNKSYYAINDFLNDKFNTII